MRSNANRVSGGGAMKLPKNPRKRGCQARENHARDERHRCQQTEGGREERAADDLSAATMKALQSHT